MTVATQWLVVGRKSSSENGRRLCLQAVRRRRCRRHHYSERDGWVVVQWVTKWRDTEGGKWGNG